MAIDTADKRFSMSSLMGLEILPIPDGTIDAGDRLQFMGLYRGIAADSPIEIIHDILILEAIITRSKELIADLHRTPAITRTITRDHVLDVER